MQIPTRWGIGVDVNKDDEIELRQMRQPEEFELIIVSRDDVDRLIDALQEMKKMAFTPRKERFRPGLEPVGTRPAKRKKS